MKKKRSHICGSGGEIGNGKGVGGRGSKGRPGRRGGGGGSGQSNPLPMLYLTALTDFLFSHTQAICKNPAKFTQYTSFIAENSQRLYINSCTAGPSVGSDGSLPTISNSQFQTRTKVQHEARRPNPIPPLTPARDPRETLPAACHGLEEAPRVASASPWLQGGGRGYGRGRRRPRTAQDESIDSTLKPKTH